METIIFIYLCIFTLISGLIFARCNCLIIEHTKKIASDNAHYLQEASRLIRDRRAPILA